MTTLIEENDFLNQLSNQFYSVSVSREKLISESTKWKNYIPSIKWYGIKNQYHIWLIGSGKDRRGLIRGDFGISYIDSQPISTKIWQKVGISFTLSIMSIILAYLISIPIGIFSAYKKDSAIDRGTSFILFTLYSMPTFFVGTLLLLYFSWYSLPFVLQSALVTFLN